MLGVSPLLAASGVAGVFHAAGQRRGKGSRVAIVASPATSVAAAVQEGNTAGRAFRGA